MPTPSPTPCGWFYALSPVPVCCLFLGLFLQGGHAIGNGPGLDVISFVAVPSSLALASLGIFMTWRRGQRRESTTGIIGATVFSAVPLLLALHALIRYVSS